jgi:hypothetical protein
MSDIELPKINKHSIHNKSGRWHPKTISTIKKWGEQSACYTYMHNKAFRIFKNKNFWFTLPIVIITTVAGMANFSQSYFDGTFIEKYVPIIIGIFGMVAGILVTIQKFLGHALAEEGHRIASISFGKFSRNIRTELSLPTEERKVSCAEFLEVCRMEYDRLLEQSPPIPKKIADGFKTKFATYDLTKPEIIDLEKVEAYETYNEQVKKIVDDALNVFTKPSILPLSKKDANPHIKKMTVLREKLQREMTDTIAAIAKEESETPELELVSEEKLNMDLSKTAAKSLENHFTIPMYEMEHKLKKGYSTTKDVFDRKFEKMCDAIDDSSQDDSADFPDVFDIIIDDASPKHTKHKTQKSVGCDTKDKDGTRDSRTI